MRGLSARLKKLERQKGSVYILVPVLFGSDDKLAREQCCLAEKKYLFEGGDPGNEKTFIIIEEYGDNVNSPSKWFYVR